MSETRPKQKGFEDRSGTGPKSERVRRHQDPVISRGQLQ